MQQSDAFQLKDPVFIYSHVEHMLPLCAEMKAKGFPLIHICMDYPEAWQYELIAVSDRTLVIPKGVFHKLKARYGDKIQRIPQSIHFPFAGVHANGHNSESPEVASLWEFEDLIYFGETAEEFACAIRRALDEPAQSPKRKMQIEAAHAHSTEALAKRLQELGILSDGRLRSAN